MSSVKDHLDYISRNGTLELIDEAGDSIHGRQAMYGLREQLKASQVPIESKKREFLHVVFSMPAGTPAAATREAVLQFCKEEFANRRYVAALHDDTDHTHVHLCVSTRDIDRADEPRLSPRKADLFRWRQGFADKLRENGIDAAASERRHRFVYQRAEHGAIRQMRADNPTSAVFNQRRAAGKAQDREMRAALGPRKAVTGTSGVPRVPKVLQAQGSELQVALKTGKRPVNPYEDQIQRSKAAALAGWGQVAKNLLASNETELATDVAGLMREAEKPVRSHAQQLYDTAQRRDKNQDHER